MPVDIKSYPSNSDKSKQVKYNKPTLTGKISVKHSSEATKQVLERANEIKRYSWYDVLLPGLKDAVWDILTTSLNIVLYGEGGERPRSVSRNGYTSYSSVSSYKRPRSRQSSPKRSTISSVRTRPEDEFIFERKADADVILDQLREAIENFGVVSVSSLFDMCDKTPPATANKYGWMDLEDAYVDHVREGYIIRFPKSLPLD